MNLLVDCTRIYAELAIQNQALAEENAKLEGQLAILRKMLSQCSEREHALKQKVAELEKPSDY